MRRAAAARQKRRYGFAGWVAAKEDVYNVRGQLSFSKHHFESNLCIADDSQSELNNDTDHEAVIQVLGFDSIDTITELGVCCPE
jgi:hypothetical protein